MVVRDAHISKILKLLEIVWRTRKLRYDSAMTMSSCRGLCTRYKVKVSSRNPTYYAGDVKRCARCMLYISWHEFKCPCCGTKLRTKPKRPNKYNEFKTDVSGNLAQVDLAV